MVYKDVNSENRLILQQALNQLTPRQKEVIYLRFYHGLTNPEISGVMDINDQCVRNLLSGAIKRLRQRAVKMMASERSEEHTSELQSRGHLVCRLLLEKKKK